MLSNHISVSTPSFFNPKVSPRKGVGTILLIPIFFLVACAAITNNDPTSYKTATDLKAESLLLIEKATDPPNLHADEIVSLRLKLRKALEYESGKGKPNTITVTQWRVLNSPTGVLIGGFLSTWEKERAGFNKFFLEEVKENVGKAFDEIIKLENAKVKN